jgi:hypothetical protein
MYRCVRQRRYIQLLFLVHLSFTTSTKYCDLSLLDVSNGLTLFTFSTLGLELLTHRFRTYIIRGSPDPFVFATLSRIRFFITHLPIFTNSFFGTSKKNCRKTRSSQIFSVCILFTIYFLGYLSTVYFGQVRTQ